MRLQFIPWREELSTFTEQEAGCLQNGNVLMHIFVVTPQRECQFSRVAGPMLTNMT